jgi:hypothetical protein
MVQKTDARIPNKKYEFAFHGIFASQNNPFFPSMALYGGKGEEFPNGENTSIFHQYSELLFKRIEMVFPFFNKLLSGFEYNIIKIIMASCRLFPEIIFPATP